MVLIYRNALEAHRLIWFHGVEAKLFPIENWPLVEFYLKDYLCKLRNFPEIRHNSAMDGYAVKVSAWLQSCSRGEWLGL